MENRIFNEGSWIFISHSSKDIDKIRLIRNEFEKWGQNPLAFHLKCLNTDTEENEKYLFDLIKKEIEARNWFVYCASEAANNSKYVQLEREYVKEVGKLQIWSLDLNKPINELMDEIKKICTRLQVFVSYAKKDQRFVGDLIIALKDKDFSVWNDRTLDMNSDWASNNNFHLSKIIREGFFLAIITENSVNSKFVWDELRFAKQNGALIIVLVFDEAVRLDDSRFDNILPIGKTAKGLSYRNLYNIPCVPKKCDMHLIANIVLEAVNRSRNVDSNIEIYDFAAQVLDLENLLQEKLNYKKNFHPEKPVLIGNGGALLDYCEYYKFPCCGKTVPAGDRVPSQSRFDGCKEGR